MIVRPPHGFLIDEATGRVVGVKNSDDSEFLFAFIAQVVDPPVSGVQATLTSDMTNSNADITLTAVEYGTAGDNISIVYVDPGAASQSLSVSVSGRAITVHLATGSNSAITSTAAQVVAALAASSAAAALVTAVAQGSGAGVVNALAVANLASGVTVTEGPLHTIAYTADGGHVYFKSATQTWVEFDVDTLPG